MNSSPKKKKKGLRLLLLVLVIVVLGGAYFGIVWYNDMQEQKNAESESSEFDPIINLNSDEVDYIAYDNGTEFLEFNHTDEDTWVAASLPEMPVTTYTVTSLVSAASSVTPTAVIADTLDDMASYGLDTPSYTLTIRDTNGTTATLYLGQKNSYSNSYYAYLEGDTHIYMINYTLATRMDKNLFDYCNPQQTAFDSQNARYMARIENGDTVMSLQKYDTAQMNLAWYNGFYWYLTGSDGKEQPADGDNCTGFLEALSAVSGSTCIDYTNDEEQLAQYGLDEENAVRFDLETNDGTDTTELTFWFGDQAEDGQYYFRSSADYGVFLISQSTAEAVLDYGERDFWTKGFSIVSIDNVNSIDVTVEGSPTLTLSIRRTQQEVESDSTEDAVATETVSTYYLNGEEYEESDFKNLYTNIIMILGDRALTEEETPVEVDPYITVVFHTDLEYFPEITIEYTYFDTNFYQATVNGVTQMLVNRNSISALAEVLEGL